MKKRIWKRLFIVLLCLALVGGITVLGINGHMKKSTSGQILSPEDAAALTDVDCILVLGCYVHDSGRPSDMLADRLHRGIELYQSGAAPKLLMSGDHGQKDYNEVKAMKLEAMGKGIPSEDIFMDQLASLHTKASSGQEMYLPLTRSSLSRRNTTSTVRSILPMPLAWRRMVLPQTIIPMWDRHTVNCARYWLGTRILRRAS